MGLWGSTNPRLILPPSPGPGTGPAHGKVGHYPFPMVGRHRRALCERGAGEPRAQGPGLALLNRPGFDEPLSKALPLPLSGPWRAGRNPFLPKLSFDSSLTSRWWQLWRGGLGSLRRYDWSPGWEGPQMPLPASFITKGQEIYLCVQPNRAWRPGALLLLLTVGPPHSEPQFPHLRSRGWSQKMNQTASGKGCGRGLAPCPR